MIHPAGEQNRHTHLGADMTERQFRHGGGSEVVGWMDGWMDGWLAVHRVFWVAKEETYRGE
jgi:hypothetical protein